MKYVRISILAMVVLSSATIGRPAPDGGSLPVWNLEVPEVPAASATRPVAPWPAGPIGQPTGELEPLLFSSDGQRPSR
jgi:hypothetical protein